jgi:hypothetical protein
LSAPFELYPGGNVCSSREKALFVRALRITFHVIRTT